MLRSLRVAWPEWRPAAPLGWALSAMLRTLESPGAGKDAGRLGCSPVTLAAAWRESWRGPGSGQACSGRRSEAEVRTGGKHISQDGPNLLTD